MKTQTPIRQLYADHFTKNSSIDFNTHGFRYEINFFDSQADTLSNERGHYILATVYYKKLIVGIIYVDNEDGVFTSYRLHLNSCFDLTLSSVNSSSVFQKKEPFKVKTNHESVQACIDEIERVRSYITDFFAV